MGTPPHDPQWPLADGSEGPGPQKQFSSIADFWLRA